MSSEIEFKGTLAAHAGWVTCIATTYEAQNMIITGSRDKKLIIWELTPDQYDYSEQGTRENKYGYARKCLSGHSGPVHDLVISSDGQFALSGSWDHTLRLWDLNSGTTVRVFKGHEKDVFSVAFSQDNRQIVSSSRDKTIKLWNTLAECKYTITEDQHTDWVSCVRFSPSAKTPLLVSCGWDKLVKVWNLSTMKLRTNLVGHTGPLYTVTISPDGSLCASGGKDGTVMLWDVTDGKHLYSLDAGCTINALVFSPKNYWLVAATDMSVKIWDLENKDLLDEIEMTQMVQESTTNKQDKKPSPCSVNWSADGNTLFVGCTDHLVYVHEVAC